ncbi:S8 family peptidase [Lachnospiraceae bacterium 54-53]
MEKILDNNYYDMIINNLLIPAFSTGDDITTLNDRFSLLHITKNTMQLCDLGKHPYHIFPSLYTLTSRLSMEKPCIEIAQQTTFSTLRGQGVIIGIIDTGIDYQHPAFIYRDKTTRLLGIWDQTQHEGEPPHGFTFGTEYTKASINKALLYDDPLSVVPTTDTNGHGTAIASIAAGTPDAAQSFASVVPNAELAVVKLKDAKLNLKNIFCVPEDRLCFQESDIVLGMRYLTELSHKLRRPLVICIALGSSQGGHDGRGVLSSYTDSLVQHPELNVTISAGNEGNSGRHYFNRIITAPYFNEFQMNVGSEDQKFSMEIWPLSPGRLSIEISSPNHESIPFVFPSFNECQRYAFQSSSSVVWVNNLAFEQRSGEQLILLRFENPLPGIWRFRVQSTENEPFSFHSWLPSGDLISDRTFFLNANPDTTITSPGNARNPLTVGAYNQRSGNILDESGRGYTRSGLVKPDLAAPGYQIPCAIPGGQYGSLTGTGAAAAHAAGAAAIVFEWTQAKGNLTYISGEQVNRLLIRRARRSNAYIYPNNIWGYGQLDVYNLLDNLDRVL